eukprot:scaffold95190_cov63-Phaeocystis_antarctica.AAC.1
MRSRTCLTGGLVTLRFLVEKTATAGAVRCERGATSRHYTPPPRCSTGAPALDFRPNARGVAAWCGVEQRRDGGPTGRDHTPTQTSDAARAPPLRGRPPGASAA